MTSQRQKVRIGFILFDAFDSKNCVKFKHSFWVKCIKRWKEKSTMFVEYLYVTENFELYLCCL